MNAIVYRLTALHRKLDDAIRLEAGARSSDAFRLLRMKRLRLAVKRRLFRHQLRALAA